MTCARERTVLAEWLGCRSVSYAIDDSDNVGLLPGATDRPRTSD